MKNKMTKRDLLEILNNDREIPSYSLYLWGGITDVRFLLEECNAACAWLNKVFRTKYINSAARGSLLKVRAGAYAGHYISDSALYIAAKHMGFTVLRERNDFFLNVCSRSIPHNIDGAFPPGSIEYIRNSESRNIQGEKRHHDIKKLPNWYKREW